MTPALATRRIDGLVRSGLESIPATFGVVVTSAQDSYTAGVRPVLGGVTTAAALVLLIASANVAILTIVRARRRERELAVRLALGASQLRLARPLQGSRPRRVETAGERANIGSANPFAVSPDYFVTVGIPLRDGRTLLSPMSASPIQIRTLTTPTCRLRRVPAVSRFFTCAPRGRQRGKPICEWLSQA